MIVTPVKKGRTKILYGRVEKTIGFIISIGGSVTHRTIFRGYDIVFRIVWPEVAMDQYPSTEEKYEIRKFRFFRTKYKGSGYR